MGYYNGYRLLHTLDCNGGQPEIYIATSNRCGGKTTYFSRFLVNEFLTHNKKFCLLYRYMTELTDVDGKFFKSIQQLFYPNLTMKSVAKARGAYQEITIQDGDEEPRPCGYAIALNGADAVKKNSHLMSDCEWIFFDEFQSENGNYCKDEIKKFVSIHTSLARGGGAQSRYLPVILCGNPYTNLNPYYTALNIATRIQDNTKLLRGPGYVLEQGYNHDAATANKASKFNIAFGGSDNCLYTAAPLSTPRVRKRDLANARYIATFCHNDRDYAIYQMDDGLYVHNRGDKTARIKLNADDTPRAGYSMPRIYLPLIKSLREFYDTAQIEYADILALEGMTQLLSL